MQAIPPHARLALAALRVDGDDQELGAAIQSCEDWRAFLGLVLPGELAPLAWSRLRNQALPAAVAQTLRARYYASAASNALLYQELIALLPQLDAAGIRPALLKGASLAWRIYQSPADRPMADLDLLIEQREVERASQLLEAMGYHRKEQARRPATMQRLSGGELQLLKPLGSGSLLVELHWWPFPGEWSRQIGLLEQRLPWERARPATLAGEPVALLHPHDQLLQLAYHLAVSHQLSAGALRMLVDIDRSLRAEPPAWPALLRETRQLRLASVLWHTLFLAYNLLNSPVPAWVLQELAPGRLRRRALLDLAGQQHILAGQSLNRGRQRYLLLLLLLDRPRDSLHLLARTIYPDRAWLAARYGSQPGARRRHLWSLLRRGTI